MKIGETQSISDIFFPDINIGIKDRNGVELKIKDKVRIYGCRADYGYIGYDGRPTLYFENDNRSVKWDIDDRIRNHIEKVNY